MTVLGRAALVVGAGAVGAAVCAAGVGALGPQSRQAAVAPAPAPTPRHLTATEERAVAYLHRAVTAEQTVDYSGTKWMASEAAGTAVTVVDVRHATGRGAWLQVRTRSRATGDGVQAAVSRGDLDGEALAALSHHYRLAVRGGDVCAGRRVTVVEAQRLATGDVAARFWFDDATGLLVRRELYDAAGGVVRATVFVRLDTGSQASPVPSGATVAAAAPGRVDGEPALAGLRRDGRHLPDVLPGGMERYRATELTVDGNRVVQLAYSDGIFTASVFVQRGGLGSGALRGFRTERMAGTTVHTGGGLHRTVVWEDGTAVYTLVLDAPAALTPSLVAALPHTPVEDGLLARLGRGIARVGSWANPFD